MAETIVENQICNACGAEIRKGALFCYNCGGAIAPKVIKTDGENQVLAKESKTENGNKFDGTKLENKPENNLTSFDEIAKKPILKSELQPEKKLKSAASLRNKSKMVQQKKVEIIWEEHENAPNVWFILAAILLTVFAGLIMWLALYFG